MFRKQLASYEASSLKNQLTSVPSQKANITHRTVQAACWLGLGQQCYKQPL